MDNFYQESFTPATQSNNSLANSNTASEESQAEASADSNGAVKVFVPAFGAEVEAEAGTPLADSLEKRWCSDYYCLSQWDLWFLQV